MRRFLAGALACFFLVSGGILIWQGHAERQSAALPPPPAATGAPQPVLALADDPVHLAKIPIANDADDKSKEQKRFARADKDRNGEISVAEMVDNRRKAFAKLDLDHDGKLSFEEYVHKTVLKFDKADANRDHQLNATEFATTAARHRKKKPACECVQPASDTSDLSDGADASHS